MACIQVESFCKYCFLSVIIGASVNEPHTSGVYAKFSFCSSRMSCRIYAHYSRDSIHVHLEYQITLMHAAVRSCTDMDTSLTVHEQSERREASNTARTREGLPHAFETAVEKEASHCYCGLGTA